MDEQGTSPLWTAADHGNLEIVKILVKAGADCDKVNKRLGGLNLKIWLIVRFVLRWGQPQNGSFYCGT